MQWQQPLQAFLHYLQYERGYSSKTLDSYQRQLQQLALANQKAKFFEDVVDVLKNDYGVSVVKKRPGKSLRKPKP